jgi:hypothetical protein
MGLRQDLIEVILVKMLRLRRTERGLTLIYVLLSGLFSDVLTRRV